MNTEPEVAQEALGEENEKVLLVIDSSVNEENPKRVHEVIIEGEIEEVKFSLDEPTVLPFKVGVKFMKDGFTVREATGEDIVLPAVATDNVAAQIASDECVAKYSELTFSALKIRAAQEVDGEIYLDADEEDRQDIINFLCGEPPESLIDDESFIEDADEVVTDEDPVVTIDPVDQSSEGDQVPVAGPEASEEELDAEELETDEGNEGSPEENGEASNDPIPDSDPLGDDGENAHGIGPDVGNGDNPDYVAVDPAQKGSETQTEETFTLDEVESSTDAALRLAVENGIDIADVTGTGDDGNVLVGDVEAYIETLPKEDEQPSTNEAPVE